MEFVFLPPPLVYGPGVKANFRALMRLVASGLPLPLAGIDNRRSLIFIDNLVDLVSRTCLPPGAAGRVLLGRGPADPPTPQPIRTPPPEQRRPPRPLRPPSPAPPLLIPAPRAAAALVGRVDVPEEPGRQTRGRGSC